MANWDGERGRDFFLGGGFLEVVLLGKKGQSLNGVLESEECRRWRSAFCGGGSAREE